MTGRSLVLGLILSSGGLLLAGLAVLPVPRGDASGTGADAEAALAEGNRLVRVGRPEEAITAYAAGWPATGRLRRAGGPEAILAYNLGTTAHRLRRLPEAILWYRRAQAARLDDPWLVENLELARAEAAATVLPVPGMAARTTPATGLLAAAAVALAWVALVLYLLALLAPHPEAAGRASPPPASTENRRPPRRSWAVAAVAALGLWAAAAAVEAWAPRPAVLLDRCEGPSGALPAASEIWVGGETGGGREVFGGPPGLVCPGRAVGLVE